METKTKLVGKDLHSILTINIDTLGRNLSEIEDALTIKETRINTAQQADRDSFRMNLLEIDTTSLLLNELRNEKKQRKQHIRYIYEYINTLSPNSLKIINDIRKNIETKI